MALTLSELRIKLRKLLNSAVKRNLAEGILLSGGLDTSIIAEIASKYTTLSGFTVAFKNAEAQDVKYAKIVANHLHINHYIHFFDKGELYTTLPIVVETLRSFDPMEIRNSTPIYIGLKFAKEKGATTIMTGDGCDELFAGYSFLFNKTPQQLKIELKKLWSVMQFSSIPLAEKLKIKAKLPYLDPDLKTFAKQLNPKYKIHKEKQQTCGKWILRKAFEKALPSEIVWREKTPIEYGTGTTILPKLFSSEISDLEFNKKRKKYLKEDKVTIRDKEQLFYYEIFRSRLGPPAPRNKKARTCPQCNSNIPGKTSYCRVCGAYPI
jgi:asparagine synthase (glutamine-hydrolysing)